MQNCKMQRYDREKSKSLHIAASRLMVMSMGMAMRIIIIIIVIETKTTTTTITTFNCGSCARSSSIADAVIDGRRPHAFKEEPRCWVRKEEYR